MFPLLFLWAPYFAPHTIYPWGGAVRQGFALETFFGSIDPEAGNGNVEHAIFKYASYGRQIGTLSDAVAILLKKEGLILADTSNEKRRFREKKLVADLTEKKIGEIVDQFTETYDGIETIKNTFAHSRIDTIMRTLPTLKEGELQAIEDAVRSARAQKKRSPPHDE
jgi:hypothetical protein